MPSRLLREGILDSTGVNDLTFPAEVFYRRLMSVVDDFGRFDGRATVLRSRLYPLKIDTVREADITRWIAECEKAGLIVLYAVDSKPYILFQKLGPARAKESKFPPPPKAIERPTPDHNTHPFTSENGCKQTQTDENGCAHMRPYSYSGSGSDSGSVKTEEKPPLPPKGGNEGRPEPDAPPRQKRTRKPRADPEPLPPIPPELDAPEFVAVWVEWLDYRASRKPAVTAAAAARMQFKLLVPLGPDAAAACVRLSIANQWQGVFPDRMRPAAPPSAKPQPVGNRAPVIFGTTTPSESFNKPKGAA